jgi:hypothetical protein
MSSLHGQLGPLPFAPAFPKLLFLFLLPLLQLHRAPCCFLAISGPLHLLFPLLEALPLDINMTQSSTTFRAQLNVTSSERPS